MIANHCRNPTKPGSHGWLSPGFIGVTMAKMEHFIMVIAGMVLIPVIAVIDLFFVEDGPIEIFYVNGIILLAGARKRSLVFFMALTASLFLVADLFLPRIRAWSLNDSLALAAIWLAAPTIIKQIRNREALMRHGYYLEKKANERTREIQQAHERLYLEEQARETG